MKILLISGDSPVPAELKDLLARGSTALVERGVDHPSASDPAGADRVVFWAGAGDRDVRELAQRYARATDRRADALVFVSGPGDQAPDGLAEGEQFVWPNDEDRLKMAFMTGA